jgi:hypothetical protein
MMHQADSSGVERTNDDASLCKRSAVHYGYWDDPYISAFVPRYHSFSLVIRFICHSKMIVMHVVMLCNVVDIIKFIFVEHFFSVSLNLHDDTKYFTTLD